MQLSPTDTLRPFTLASGQQGWLHALSALRPLGLGEVSRLPVSLRMVLESMLRHVDGVRVTEAQVRALANWQPQAPRTEELPMVVSRILLQDFTGGPLLCDLAAMRDRAQRLGAAAVRVTPCVPVDLVVDHSVQVDHWRGPDALALNGRLEFERNNERYRFIRWGTQAFDRVRAVPPGVGIVHQVNLEFLAPGVHERDGTYFPDSLVGTDSHTTMINGLGVLAWGVGGIEAQAAMLGEPVTLLTPDVVGVHLTGQLSAGTTATDLVLLLTQRLRQARVVGQFVEFFGEGAASLSLPDRATVSNMAPEYGATIGFFPPDDVTAGYLLDTGRSAAAVDAFRSYFQAQGLFGMPRAGDIDYSRELLLDLTTVVPCVAGPSHPQDLIPLPELPARFEALLNSPTTLGGYGVQPTQGPLAHGDVLIAAITSCTNTSNPQVMLAAGLLAQRAVARGMRVAARIKTSLAPGSRVVTDYLQRAGLLAPLAELGFQVVAYGCTTCIGNSGPLPDAVMAALGAEPVVGVAVLSGNRNFEARIHPAVQANFLMSPPLVVAFALAGRIGIDLTTEALGLDRHGQPVWLHELWPSAADVAEAQALAGGAAAYQRLYAHTDQLSPAWTMLDVPAGLTWDWAPSTYLARPPFLDDVTMALPAWQPIQGARALLMLGDAITTDHISPAGAINEFSNAGQWLQAQGVSPSHFNSYGARRGQHEVMVRGTFAHGRLRNLMMPARQGGGPTEGSVTPMQPGGQVSSVFDAAMIYQQAGTPVLVFAGEDYGSGSSRDWAAKGTRLLGVRAVIARSFERIHRANLVGMGVLPLQFMDTDSIAGLHLQGDERFDVDTHLAADGRWQPGQTVTLHIHRAEGGHVQCPLRLCVDTALEAEYLRHGGLQPYLLRKLLADEPADLMAASPKRSATPDAARPVWSGGLLADAAVGLVDEHQRR
ncbi:MAG: aconitate hydratase 1 [Burkholderiales bacterium PBB6]|nr:MAG: aconitate hydratase 1 [Burkholderiales bacterium PBB6]